jgi:hypothetical protein
MTATKIIVELEILKVNGKSEKELRYTAGFRKGATTILDNMVKELPKHFQKFRMRTKATGRVEIPPEEKKDE